MNNNQYIKVQISNNVGQRYATREKEMVTFNYDLTLNYLKTYIKEKELEKSHITTALEEFKKNRLQPEKYTFIDLLQYLSNEERIVDNKYLYKDLLDFMAYAQENNLIHINRKEYYEKFLNQELFKCNSELLEENNSSKYSAINYSRYEHNNFRKTYGNEVLNKLASMGGAIYLNSDAKICLRFSENSTFKQYTMKQAEVMLSSKLGFNIKITENEVNYVDLNEDLLFLPNKIQGNM